MHLFRSSNSDQTTGVMQIIDHQIDQLRKRGVNSVPLNLLELNQIEVDSFPLLQERINNGRYRIVLNQDRYVYPAFHMLADDGSKRFSKILIGLSYLIAGVICLLALVSQTYGLLIAISFPRLAKILSSTITKLWLVLVPAIFLSFYLSIAFSPVIGLGGIGFSAILACRYLIRSEARQTLKNVALSRENIFCFLFYSGLINLWDRGEANTIYSPFNIMQYFFPPLERI